MKHLSREGGFLCGTDGLFLRLAAVCPQVSFLCVWYLLRQMT